MNLDVIQRLPKTDLHVHLDGSLRIPSLIEMAKERKVELPSESEAGLRERVFRPSYRNLQEYLEGFRYTVAVLQDKEALERATVELCEDCQQEGVRYVEIRFAPQLHVRPGFELGDVVRAVDRGIRRAAAAFNAKQAVVAGKEPRFLAGMILCALRYFTADFSPGYRRFFEAMPEAPEKEVYSAASMEVARAARAAETRARAARGRHRPGGPGAGLPRRRSSAGLPDRAPGVSRQDRARRRGLRPRVDLPAIGDLHADRIGHGTWLLDETKIRNPRITDRKAYIEGLAQFIADKRVTIEVCLTSNQQTVPELAGDLKLHPFAEMRKRRLSTTFCTDNRLVSNTNVSNEIVRAVEAFSLTEREVRDILIYGFKRSFFPGTYMEKRGYVREVIDFADRVLSGAQGPS
jgi:adenosine deaminase